MHPKAVEHALQGLQDGSKGPDGSLPRNARIGGFAGDKEDSQMQRGPKSAPQSASFAMCDKLEKEKDKQ